MSCTMFSFGQNMGTMEINDTALRAWLPKVEIEYAGIYHFGESESELRIFFSGALVIAQIKSGYWEDGTGSWKWKYENLSNIIIQKDGQFKSDKYSGQFVIYRDSTSNHKALRIDNPWNTWLPKGGYEVGIRTDKNPYMDYSGKYPQASYKWLMEPDIDSLSKSELQIMRNEIFARYGLKFKAGGEMDTYFKKQGWYKADNNDVNNFLTELERQNIALIKEVEKNKGH